RADSQGDVWANGDIDLLGSGAFHLAGDVVAGGDVEAPGDSTYVRGNILSEGDVELSPATVVSGGIVGANIEALAPRRMPDVPTPRPGSANVTVNAGAVTTLAPGAYGSVLVKPRGTLVLARGSFVFKSLALQASSAVKFDPGAPLDDPSAEMK